MLLQETFRKLHEMKLLGIAQGLEEQLQNPTSQDLAFEERIGLLVDHEHTHREARRLKRLLAKAKLRENACLENIDYRTARSLDKGLIASLALENARPTSVTASAASIDMMMITTSSSTSVKPRRGA